MKWIAILIIIFVAGAGLASPPTVQGELDVQSYVEQMAGISYQVSGEFHDLSVVGFTGLSVTNGNLLCTENILGSVDFWTVTNVLYADAIVVTAQVVYAESGSSDVGMVTGYGALCSLSTNSAGYLQQPSPEFTHVSQNMLSQIRNYSFRRITGTGGGSTNTTDSAAIHTNQIGGGLLWNGSVLTSTNTGGAGTTNASDIGVAFTPTNYVPTSPDVDGHFVGMDEEFGYLTTATNDLSSRMIAVEAQTGIVGAVTGLIKSDGEGNISAANPGTDYQTPLVAGVDYQTPLNGDGASLSNVVHSEIEPAFFSWLDTNNYVSKTFTNIIVTGDLSPDVSGTYYYQASQGGFGVWTKGSCYIGMNFAFSGYDYPTLWTLSDSSSGAEWDGAYYTTDPRGNYAAGVGAVGVATLAFATHTISCGFNYINNGWEVLLDGTNQLFSTTNTVPGSTICCSTNVNSAGKTNICTFLGTITYP